MTIIYQPKGPSTEVKNGTILVASQKGSASGEILGANYTINSYVSNLPTTGTINSKYDSRFTGCAPCQ